LKFPWPWQPRHQSERFPEPTDSGLIEVPLQMVRPHKLSRGFPEPTDSGLIEVS